MRIFDDYTSRIKNVMQQPLYEHFDGRPYRQPVLAAMKDAEWSKPLASLIPLQQELGTTPNYSLPLGAHPDFSYISTSDTVERHYVASMFIDICNSTGLFRKYPPETVNYITSVIQKAAMHVCLICGGYIQRLHGDGMFVYFGRRGQDKREAVQLGMLASSLVTYFVKEELPKLFEEDGIERIKTRIGFDFGDDDAVVWVKQGIGATSEVTTTSLHTSLAAKMQVKADDNGVVVGKHVLDIAGIETRFFSPVSQRTKEGKDAFIFHNYPTVGDGYRQYDFAWQAYLRSMNKFNQTPEGQLELKRSSDRVLRPDLVAPRASTVRPYRP